MKQILFDYSPAEGGNSSREVGVSEPVATAVPATPATPSGNEPPPAATTVLNGKTEHEIFLEKELEKKNQRERELEMTVSERERDLQLERERQRQISTPTQQPKPKRSRLLPTVINCEEEEEESTE